MKTAILTLAILTATSVGALAAEQTGTIRSVNKKADSFTLSDGRVFALPENIEVESLKVGEKVTVAYTTKGGKHLADSVQPAM